MANWWGKATKSYPSNLDELCLYIPFNNYVQTMGIQVWQNHYEYM